jgi:hypothetical protein
MAFTPPHAARPWTFRLLVLSLAGVLTTAILLGNAALSRRSDAQRRATVVADLKRLDAAQRTWEARRGDFARIVRPVATDSSIAFVASPGVELTFSSHSALAWSATAKATDPLSEPAVCGIFRGPGPVAPHRAVTHEGVVACW